MRLGLEKKNKNNNNNIIIIIKAASSDEGTSHPGSPPTVASERQGTVSNMHLKRKI